MLQALAMFSQVEAISTSVAWSANTASLNAVALFSLPILLVFSSHGRHPRLRFVVFACLFSLPLAMIHFFGIGLPNSSALPSCKARCAVIGQIIDVQIDRNQRMTRILLRAERFGARLDQAVDLDFWLSEGSDWLRIGDRLTGWASRQAHRARANHFQAQWPWPRVDPDQGRADLLSVDAISGSCPRTTACLVADWVSRIKRLGLNQDAEQTILALTLGQVQSLDADRWRALSGTGAVHLLIISGLHISALMLGTFQVLLLCRVTRSSAFLIASLGTLTYLQVIGLSIPALRAWIMTCLVLGTYAYRLPININSVLGLALIDVLMVFPRALAEPGFWFSFVAVGYLVNSDLVQASRFQRMKSLVKVQMTLSLLSWPILWLQGSPIVLLGWLFNLVLVPSVVFIIFPLSCLTALWAILFPQSSQPLGASWMLQVIDPLMQGFWRAASKLGELSPQMSTLPVADWAAGVSLGLILLATIGRRVIGTLWPFYLLLALSLQRAIPAAPGNLELWVLDVGQGTSVLVRTHRWSLLYDTGPANEWHNAGETTVAPFLSRLGIRQLDYLVISHSDSDHAGGLSAVLKQLEAQPTKLIQASHCQLNFSPEPGVHLRTIQVAAGRTTNDRSCNLMISYGSFEALLMGDPSVSVEPSLARQIPSELDWLLVSHHGAGTSSSPAWLNHVKPKYAVISAGARNAFGHPHPDVIERLKRRDAQVFSTSKQGGLVFEISTNGQVSWRSVLE